MCDEEENDSRKMSTESISNYQAVPDADRETASTALQEFEEGKFSQSVTTLRKLLFKRPQDLKVIHNINVVEYYCEGCKETENFRRNISEICKQAHINMEDADTLDDVDNSVLVYNQAVVLYHLHQYNAALHVLERVVQFLEPLEETLARNICLLLLDSYLNVYQPKRVSGFVPHMETSYFNNSKNSGKKEKDGQKEENSESCVAEQFKRRFQLCKARLFATLKTSKACKREIKNLMSSGSGVQNIPAFYLKSQLEYQRGNYRKALKLLHSATMPNDLLKYFQDTGDCLPVIFYNNVGCIHFYMGKPHLGKFYIKKAIEEFEKHILAVTDQKVAPENVLNSRPLHLLSLSIRHQLIYNLGMQCMQGQNFHDAFKCFVEVLRSYYSNPRLWLRIAECCIQIHKPDNVNQFIECSKRPLIKVVVGSGPHRKLILNSSTSEVSLEDFKHLDLNEITPSLHFAMICLKNAKVLLPEHHPVSYSGIFHTLPSSLEDMGMNASDENYHLSVLPSTYILGAEIISLRNSILIASSYVSLCLGDVLMAHEYAKLLLSQPRISGAHKFLAHLYNGEALLLMDRITEAVEHLNFQDDNDIELAFPASSSEVSLKHQMRFDSKLSEKNDDGSRPVGNIPNWFPNTISSARFISQYNLAVAYSVREEWSKALECLQQMNPNGDIPSQALSLLIYVQLHQGTADEIKTYIKQSLIAGYG